jgi:hypothetical protein
MNYTEMYNKVYAELQSQHFYIAPIPHEAVHRSSIAICEAIANLWSLTEEHNPNVLNVITEIIEDLHKKDLNI